MPPTKSVILLELNELTPTLMFRFIEEGHLPNFERLFADAKVFTTTAQEEGLHLNPWIQWVTVHSGVPFSEHGVFLLGEGRKSKTKGLVDLISDAGMRVWMCGSMNVRFQAPVNGAALPDAWATDIDPFPSELQPYFRFVGHPPGHALGTLRGELPGLPPTGMCMPVAAFSETGSRLLRKSTASAPGASRRRAWGETIRAALRGTEDVKRGDQC